MRVLISWLGKKDIEEAGGIREGAIATLATAYAKGFDKIYILIDNEKYFEKWGSYEKWLKQKLKDANLKCGIDYQKINDIDSPINFKAVAASFKPVLERFENDEVVINLSSGTRAGTAISILLGHFIHKHEIVQVKDGLIIQSNPPFDFKGEFIEKTGQTIEQATISAPKVENAFDKMVANSSAMQETIRLAKRLVPYPWPCLILGETGTGKDVMAQAISKATEKKLVSVNCAAIPAELIESELFGHEKGAFSGASKVKKGFFEQANNNILFLDEIGDLPLDAQTKFLRVLQNGIFHRVGGEQEIRVKVRVICATHKNLVEMIENGEFREDLYYRLNIGVIKLPALKDRKEDIWKIAENLLDELNKDCAEIDGFSSKYFHKHANSFINNYSWPGNVRELKNTIARAVLHSDSECITSKDLQLALLKREEHTKNDFVLPDIKDGIDANNLMKNIKKALVKQALNTSSNKATLAAQLLGLEYRTFKNWEKDSTDLNC